MYINYKPGIKTYSTHKPSTEDEFIKNTIPANPTIVRRCSKCGLELKLAMWYYCSRFPCPAGLGSKIRM